MIHVTVAVERSINTVMASPSLYFFEEETTARYKNSTDTVSLVDTDGLVDDIEDKTIGDLQFLELLSLLPEKNMLIVALGLYVGLSQGEIAAIMHCHRDTVMRTKQRMMKLLSEYSNPVR